MHLFNRFMSEALDQRGGVEKVVNFLLPISEFIKSNPIMLQDLNEIASYHLDACINQPVAGMSELVLVVDMFSKDNIVSSLESARVLRALYIVREEVAKKIGTSNSRVHAELANAMYREVHKELKKNGSLTQDWLGVPDSVAYETAIKSYLTPENISSIASKVKTDALDSSLKEIAGFVREGRITRGLG